VFLANGEEVRFRDLDRDAHFRPVATIFGRDELERRLATRTLRVPPTEVALDARVAGRPYQRDCIDVLCREIELGRRKLLVEMATGSGKTRMAAALIKRLFDASWITRALFLVDRTTLAKQTEDAFAEHVPTLPAYRVPRTGERFRPEKQITICTLQTMINEYRNNYSAGYFDLIVIDECHRGIYGEYRRVLDHFDAVKIGLTATPLVGRPPEDADPDDAAFVRDTLRFFELAEPTYRYTLEEAINDRFLVPYRIYRARTVKTAATGGFEVRREEIDWAALDPGAREALEEAFGDAASITVDPSALERTFTIPERNRAMVREFREVLERGYTGSDGVRRVPDRGKTIVFAVTKRHAAEAHRP
jgi:type I restriction enzyme, R subunit